MLQSNVEAASRTFADLPRSIKRQIMEFKVDDVNPAVKLITDSPTLYDSTYLTAFCDRKGLRHIFFRLESGNVSSYNQDDQSSTSS